VHCGAGLSLPIRAKLGLFLAPILQGFLCAFLCVLSGNPSELGDFPSLCSRQSSTLVRAALPGSGISAVSAPGFLFPSASPRLPPCLRGSASKSLPRFPSPFHHGPLRGIVLCAFLCVLSGNPSELGDFPSLCSRQSSTLVRAALPGSGISAVSAPGFLFPSASPRLPPCLRGSASKSLPRFPSPFHHGPARGMFSALNSSSRLVPSSPSQGGLPFHE
jgi:hypothetical protein